MTQDPNKNHITFLTEFGGVVPLPPVDAFDKLCLYFKDLPAMHIHDLPTIGTEFEVLSEELTEAFKGDEVDATYAHWSALISHASELAEHTALAFESALPNTVVSHLYGYLERGCYLVIVYTYENTFDVFVWHSDTPTQFNTFLSALESAGR